MKIKAFTVIGLLLNAVMLNGLSTRVYVVNNTTEQAFIFPATSDNLDAKYWKVSDADFNKYSTNATILSNGNTSINPGGKALILTLSRDTGITHNKEFYVGAQLALGMTQVDLRFRLVGTLTGSTLHYAAHPQDGGTQTPGHVGELVSDTDRQKRTLSFNAPFFKRTYTLTFYPTTQPAVGYPDIMFVVARPPQALEEPQAAERDEETMTIQPVEEAEAPQEEPTSELPLPEAEQPDFATELNASADSASAAD